MRGGLAAFWILMAGLEISRRANPVVVTWLGGFGPWLVLIMTLLPIIETVREFRQRRPVHSARTAGGPVRAAALGLWVLTPLPHRQDAALQRHGPDSPEYRRLRARLNRMSGVAALIVLVITYLMVAKPALWGVNR